MLFLSLNTWGLKYVSKHRQERLRAIAARLAESDYTVVALQEVWCTEDWEEISAQCSSTYPYRRWFSSGVIAGPGLAILSKHPIKSTFLYRFPVNGRPSAFWRGDWYVGKSIAVTILDVNDGQSVAVLNSHLHAPYSLVGDAKYECHRTVQAWDFSKLIQVLKDAGHAVIVVGDLNSRPGELSYELLTQMTGLVDSWEQVNEMVDLQVLKSMEPLEQVEIGGCTCDSVLNTWRAHREPWEACRLDYALVDNKLIKVNKAKVVFTEEIAGVGSYSDHFGYEVDLQLRDITTSQSQVRTATVPLEYQAQIHQDLLSLISTYEKTSKWQKQWRLTHFFVSIVAVIAMLVATSFTSSLASWSSVLWVFAATFIGITGVIDGILGFIFGNYELRQLKEVELEVKDGMRWLQHSEGK
jgi:sphingomyelin phosphodiesterase 2